MNGSILLGLCLYLFIDTAIAQPSVFNWPAPIDTRTSHYDKKHSKKKRPAAISNKVFIEKKRLPKRNKIPNRAFTETAFSNHVHQDNFFNKRQNPRFSDLNKQMVYNRQRNPEKVSRKRK